MREVHTTCVKGEIEAQTATQTIVRRCVARRAYIVVIIWPD